MSTAIVVPGAAVPARIVARGRELARRLAWFEASDPAGAWARRGPSLAHLETLAEEAALLAHELAALHAESVASSATP